MKIVSWTALLTVVAKRGYAPTVHEILLLMLYFLCIFLCYSFFSYWCSHVFSIQCVSCARALSANGSNLGFEISNAYLWRIHLCAGPDPMFGECSEAEIWTEVWKSVDNWVGISTGASLGFIRCVGPEIELFSCFNVGKQLFLRCSCFCWGKWGKQLYHGMPTNLRR